ncbi:hypothetical protein Cgig2_024695 [Carnegiea gigantea]|uniref:Zinc finger CCCH domain-containing protein 18-like n=1 Tax=Carnegiea gigantea TaxID=171969 RepID=A0A9Q1JWC5_9CARY|nr:hypothetical protein Cgig2_024695 [Carnegiea gigantea]
MDFSEAMKIVTSRIEEIEPGHAYKIVGYLLLQEGGGQDIIRLAFSPDPVIKSVINQVKTILGLSAPNHQLIYVPISPPQSIEPPSIADLPLQLNPYRAPSHSRAYSWNASWDSQPQGYSLEDQFQHFLNLNDGLDSGNLVGSELAANSYYSEQGVDDYICKTRVSRRTHSLSEFPPKVCHYFNKGFCKHGNSCKYFHGNPMTLESFSQFLGLAAYENGRANRNGNDDHNGFPPKSLEELEMEIVELLRSRNGNPVSIASLPILYYERYGRTLQAEGYLAESQRHGKVGYNLTKLLARLKKSIRLIDRPHGQHSVILAEDAPKYFQDQTEKFGIVPESCQIYLTFPAESTFTEQDVSDYFSTFGPVQDVRIPSQQKRMFGFVTFVYPETVQKIFAKGNPHFICGARVLVKPYKEKSRPIDRKQAEKLNDSMNYKPQFFDGKPDFHSLSRSFDSPVLTRKQFMEEHNEALEFEKRHCSESPLIPKPSDRLQYFSNSIDELKLAEEFPTSDCVSFGLDVHGNESSNNEHLRNMTSGYGDQESDDALNLPDNPFLIPIANSTSTLT